LPLGLFYDESPHLLYLLRHFLGDDRELLHTTVVPSTRTPPTATPAQVTGQYGGAVPATLVMNFEAPVSEWHVVLLGDRGLATVDVFRDIATFVPNDELHRTRQVLRTSIAGTVAHWWGYARSGPAHMRGRLRYGNDEVFRRFARAVRSGRSPEGIAGVDGLAVVRAQHDLLAGAGIGKSR
jgi:predicted dehydrogenase